MPVSGAQRDWLAEAAVYWVGIHGAEKGRKNFLGRGAWPGCPRSRVVPAGVKGGENSGWQPGGWGVGSSTVSRWDLVRSES